MVSCFCVPFHLPRRTRKREKLDEPHSSEPAVQDTGTQGFFITRIRAKNVAISLRRIPVGFYVTVESNTVAQKTSIKALSVGTDLIEWVEEMILPSDPSLTISFTIIASFELGPTLGNGEVVHKFEITVGELLDHIPLVKFSEQQDDEVGASVTFEVEIDQQAHESIHAATTNNLQVTGETRQLAELTDMGHVALARYREHQEQRDLDESITHFERAQSLCPLDHPCRATALFNLASAKLIYCRVNDTSDFDMSVNLYRAALCLRPRSHPDHPSTLLSLGVALLARYQRKRDEADEAEGEALLSQVQDVSSRDSYEYLAAALALGSAANPELLEQMDKPDEDDESENAELEHEQMDIPNQDENAEPDEDGDSVVQLLDVVMQRILYTNPSSHAFLDPVGVLLCFNMDYVHQLVEPDKAIPMLEVVLQSTSDSHPEKISWLNDIGNLLLARYERTGDIVRLEQSISMREEAVRLIPHDDPSRPAVLGQFGNSLSTRYTYSGDVVDLEKSISLTEEALQLTPDGHPDKPVWLGDLGLSLSTRYERFGDVVDLEKSISLREEALQLTPEGHPDKPGWLSYLGASLSTRYELSGDVVDLENSISFGEEALQLTPGDNPNKASMLNNLGFSLSTRYEHFGDIVDLNKSISLGENALQLAPDDNPNKASMLNNLGSSLSIRYEHFGDVADLDKSISFSEKALQLTPSNDHPNKASRLNSLGSSLSTRYERFGNVVDLKKSISLGEEALQLTPDDNPNKAAWLNNLGSLLSTRYERFGDVVDLEKSISLGEEALQLTPDDHPHKASRLNNLGASLSTRYQRFGDVVNLEKSISLREEALQLTLDSHPNKATWLNNLGHSLLTRYERFGDIIDLGKSISLREEALQLTLDSHPDKPVWLNNLGNSLSTRYERFGDIVDLEKSISLGEEALHLTPDDNPNKGSRLNNLGSSFSIRYQRFGDVVDLEKSISFSEEALQLTPDGHPNKSVWLSDLGLSLSTRYQRLGDVVDLEKSISLGEEALRLTPDGHNKATWMNNLVFSLLTRYERFGAVDDLEKSISLTEEGLKLTPDGHPNKATLLNNLGSSLSTRYERFGDIIDLEKSISLGEEALQLTPDDGHPVRCFRLHDLSVLLFSRFLQSGTDPSDNPDLSRATIYSTQAARYRTGSPSDCFQSSQLWIRCVRLQYDSQSLLDAYTVAVDLLPQLAWMGLSLHDRYHQLLRATDTVCDAAAAALDAHLHLPERAVEWLEQGRSIMWSQHSQLRTPVDALRAAYPELATQFERASHELEQAGGQNRTAVKGFIKGSTLRGRLLESQAAQYHGLALERERLLTEIRDLPGFERFLLPKTIAQLSSLAHSGPVIFLNASEYRCDALVVMTGSERVIHVPLSKTTHDEVAFMRMRLNRFLNLNGRVILRDDMERAARLSGMTPEDVFGHILPALWEKVVSPILVALGLLTPPGGKLPRIFWCPTGPFSFLPIHAAGHYGKNNSGRKVSDFVISSYIPTMAALQLQEELEIAPGPGHVRLLAVPQPSTDGQRELNGVPKEMGIIRVLSSPSPFVELKEADGTVEDVLQKMTESDWVHFACHGTQDRANPLDSGLLLAHQRRLRISDIVRLSRPRGGLAFLSACQTATGDEQLSEEAIHLAAGMLLAGYKGVVATMWTIMDSDAPKVTEDVYKMLFQSGEVPDSSKAAEALHHAIERLRESGAPFLSWVPFIHVGL